MNRKVLVNLLAVLALVVGAVYFYWKFRVAPDLKLAELRLTDLNGNSFDANSLRGKAVFVNYWATWCPDCLKEMPSIGKACENLKGENIVFLMISDEHPARISSWLQDHPYPMTFVKMEGRFQEAGINAIPTTYLLDKDGKEVYSIVGGTDWSDPSMTARLKQIAQ